MSLGTSETPIRLTDAQRLDWLRLIRSESVGPRTFRALVNRYGGAGAALEALPRLGREKLGRPIAVCPREEAERELALIDKRGFALVSLGESAYPAALRAIDDAPPLITVAGRPAILDKPSVAIVGSRNASAVGRRFAADLAAGIGTAGFVVVSGLARGIDAAAHEAAIATGTVAVIAGGHDKLYPPDHAPLVERIVAAGGAVVSEMPLGWEPRGRDFPRRNRLVSGLSLGVVVVEAARRSGSLITARFALEQGREVFAVPGSPLDPRAEGANDLIREGATLCAAPEHVTKVLSPLVEAPLFQTGAEEPTQASRDGLRFWDELDLDAPADPPRRPAQASFAFEEDEAPAAARRPPPEADTSARERLMGLLSVAPIALDEIVRQAAMPAREVQRLLLELELDGRVTRHAGGQVGLA